MIGISPWGSVLLGLLLLSSWTFQQEAGQYDGYKLYGMYVTTQEQYEFLVDLQTSDNSSSYDVWKLDSTLNGTAEILVSDEMEEAFIQQLEENNIDYWVESDDINSTLASSNITTASFSRVTNAHTYFMTYYQILSWIHTKSRLWRSFISIENLGRTYEGRRIALMKISRDRTKPIIWIDAGIHAREWLAPATAMYVVDKLLENTFESNSMLRQYQFYILPLLNPDGYEYSHTTHRLWRKNRSGSGYCVGVDLNRNFNYRWGGAGTSTDFCAYNYRGPRPNSEQETQAVTRKLNAIKRNTRLYLSFHSYGQYILTPFGYQRGIYPPQYQKMIQMASTIAGKLRSQFRVNYRVGSAADVLYPAAGGSDDYAASIGIPYSYTIELPDQGRYGFQVPPNYIIPAGNQMWFALQEFVSMM